MMRYNTPFYMMVLICAHHILILKLEHFHYGGQLFGTGLAIEIIVPKAVDVSCGVTVPGDKECVS